ncbi:MAG: enoyl-CoA hydratase-related protein [Acidimicrobiales bacterium]|nr:enoyl-CoA hydratase-related protein [Acidimicrobiales bacterium]
MLKIENRDGVRTLAFNRPERLNAFNQALWYATRDALAASAEDQNVSCVVLTGTGRAFSAGQDLGEMADPSVFEHGEEPGYRALMPVLESFPKPLVAAVNGVGVGIGFTMLLHCDLVLMAESARLRTPFVSLGVTTEASASLLLPAVMGWQRAAHLLFTEPWLSATDAVAAGIALEVVPDDRLLERAQQLAATIAAMPLDSLMTTKRLMLAARADAVRAAREREEAEFERLVGQAANQAALSGFLKR